MREIPKNIERILIIRLSALGDCIAAIPVFTALRKHFPKAHIAWAIQDNFAPLLHNMQGLDELIIFPRQRWKEIGNLSKKWLEAKRFIRHLRLRHVNVTVDVQSNTKSGIIAALTGTSLRISHGKGESKEFNSFFTTYPVISPPGMQHILQKNLHLLSPLGIYETEPEFQLPVDPLAHRKIKKWLNNNGIEEKKFVLMVPFCGHPKKEWPKSNFTILANLLQKNSIPAVFIHSPGKENLTAEFISNAADNSVFVAPKTDILELIELIRSCGVIIGGDTGPVQIAGALNIPSIALFGPTAPERSKPWYNSQVFHLDVNPEEVLSSIRKRIQ